MKSFERKGAGRFDLLQSSFLAWSVDISAAGAPLSEHIAGELLISPEEASDLIDFGSVQIQGRAERNPSRSLAGGEQVRVYWPRHGTRRFYEIDSSRILYRDRYLIAYDKEAGTPSQQTPSDAYNNLFAALQRYIEKEGSKEPYVAIHHRLDQETSGVMVFALEKSANRRLGSAFENRRVVKDYLAWVDGSPGRESWVSNEDIGRNGGRYCVVSRGEGKPAETVFRVIHREGDRALVWARPKTGRTHQIRLHLSAAGCPVAGDKLYGKTSSTRLFLHAYRIKLPHPVEGSELIITTPTPSDWLLPHSVAIPD